MSNDKTNDRLARVKEIATLAGLKAGIDEARDCVVTGFQFSDGRSQGVYVRVTGETPEGKCVIGFFSPCLQLKGGMLSSGLSKSRALDLLKRNEQMMFGRFGMARIGNDDFIVVSSDQILETMDPEEFTMHTTCVAMYADRYEKEHGRDVF